MFKGINNPFSEGIIDDALNTGGKIVDNYNKSNDKLGYIGSGLNTVGTVADNMNDVLKHNTVDTRSIVARARNSILQFPIYVTQTIRVNEAQIIGGLFERVYASLVQSVLSQNPIISEEEANNLVFLKQFHTNIREAADVLINKYYEPIDDFDRMLQESIYYTQQLSENCRVEFSVVPTDNDIIIKESARLSHEPLTGFPYLQEATYNNTEDSVTTTKTKKEEYVNVPEDDIRNMAMNNINISEKERSYLNMSDQEIKTDILILKRSSQPVKPDANASQDEIDAYKDAMKKWSDEVNNITANKIEYRNEIRTRINDETDLIKRKIKQNMIPNYTFKNGRFLRLKNEVTTQVKNDGTTLKPVERGVDAPMLLRDGDIKKINGLLPYTMKASFIINNTKSGFNREVNYVIGIKSIMHLIRTQDLADDLNDLVTGKIKSLRKVKYKTGEISFKDYMFNIKGLKKDAAKHTNSNKRWINTLKRLSDYNNMKGSLFKAPIKAITGGDVPIPNATLILSQPDVTSLTNQTGIDLSVASNAARLARNLFLIAVVIVDSSAGSMRVLFPDSSSDWDVQSLATVDSELAKTDNSQLMRELNRMVNH